MSRRTRLVTIVAVACLLIVPIAAFASDRFTDVPNSNIFHGDISWLADAGVTLGCNPPANDAFCPGNNVTREQMAAFMRRLAENQVVDAATAVTAGTAHEAVHAGSESITGTNAGTANSIATLDSLPAGSYVVMASWSASVSGVSAAARIVCELSVGTTSAVVIAAEQNPFGQESMAGVITGTLTGSDEVNLSCWAENLAGSLSIHNTRVVAYPVVAVESVNVTD